MYLHIYTFDNILYYDGRVVPVLLVNAQHYTTWFSKSLLQNLLKKIEGMN